MGCGASSPVKDRDGRVMSAKTHADLRAKDGSQRGPTLDVGPGYRMGRHLGRGGTGDTWLFTEEATGREVAIKFLKRPLPKVLVQNITREFTIQAELGYGHANVIQAFEALLTPTHLCLVMEYAAGGSLTAYVADKWRKAQELGLFLSEDEARYFFKQFLAAVEYCHSHLVAHRDLKLDNTLLDAADPPALKICDFGFAKTWSEEANMFTQIGTPVYMSPELIHAKPGEANKGYDGRSVDVWASGILLLVMLLGSFPFDHTEHPDPNTSEAHLEVWLQQVSKRWSEVPHMAEAAKKLSPEVKDLLNRIFVIDAGKRVTIEQIKRHPWYKAPLPPRLAAAAARVQLSQEQLDAHHKLRQRSKAAVEQRNKELEALVLEATRLPAEDEPRMIKRIDLSEEAVLARMERLSASGAVGAAGAGAPAGAPAPQ